MDLEKIAQDLKDNPPVEVNLTTDADPTKYAEFLAHQCKYTRKENPVTGASGGATSYQFTPTSLGTILKVKCECGKEDDLTDYRNW
jgi:hypothetical protein